jgi:hypothetical protein
MYRRLRDRASGQRARCCKAVLDSWDGDMTGGKLVERRLRSRQRREGRAHH